MRRPSRAVPRDGLPAARHHRCMRVLLVVLLCAAACGGAPEPQPEPTTAAAPHPKDAAIHTSVMGSDHCPISVELDDRVMGGG